jgi:hypothetical protein
MDGLGLDFEKRENKLDDFRELIDCRENMEIKLFGLIN